jgi:hypothetical protein
MKEHRTLKITLSALAFLVLSGGVAYAASGPGLYKFRELSEEQQETLGEARDLRESGDIEGAHKLMEKAGIPILGNGDGIRDNNGLGNGNKSGNRGNDRNGIGMRPRFSQELMAHREDVREAIENNDYDKFVELTENSPREVDITEDTFDKLVTAHSLRVDGNYEEARQIMDELGYRRGPMNR